MRRRVTGLVLGALALALAMGAWSLTLGSYPLSLPEVYQVLTGAGSGAARFIVLDLRLPRVLVALAVGAMLAMAGAIFQGIVRNPLVAPDIIGVNSGAAVAAVLWIVMKRPAGYVPAAAFAGALLAAAVIYALTWRGGSPAPG